MMIEKQNEKQLTSQGELQERSSMYSHQRMCVTMIAILVLSVLFTSQVSAEYWGTTSKIKQADMAMQDIQLPTFSPTTYHAFWHTWIVSKSQPKGNTAFCYAGSVFNDHHNPDKYAKTMYQWAFWHHGAKSGERNITPVWGYPRFALSNEVGEGANAKISGDYHLHAKQWYRHVLKLWSPSNKEDAEKFSYAGWWMKDLDGDKKWRLLSVFKLPMPDARFKGSGLGGFIERFGGQGKGLVRGQSSRNLYTHKDGKWESCDFRSYPKKNEYRKFTQSKEGDPVTLELMAEPFEGAKITEESVVRKVNSSPQPPMGKLGLSRVKAMRRGENVLVSWKLADDSTPQLKSSIELFAKDQKTPLLVVQSDMPQDYDSYLELDSQQAAKVHSVRVTTTDIFNQSAVKEVEIDSLMHPAQPSVKISEPKNGIKISYYELKDALKKVPITKAYANWGKLPEFDSLTLARTVYTKNLDLDSRTRDYGFVAKIESSLKVEREGLYRFHFKAFQGGELRIGGKVLLKQEIHGSGNELSGWVVLEKGFHPIEMRMYCDSVTKGRSPKVELSYEGPGLTKSTPVSNQWFLPSSAMPTVTMKLSIESGSGKDSNLATFKLNGTVAGEGEIEKVEIVNQAGEVWLTSKTLPIESTIFLPEGKLNFRPRLYFKNKTVVDLESVSITVKNPEPEGWSLVDAGKKPSRPFGHGVESNQILLMGDGTRWATRKVEGDFTFTMRVKDFSNAVGKSQHSAKVGFGFMARENATQKKGDKTFRWSYNPYYKGRYELPGKSFHGLNNEHWRNSGHGFAVPGQFRFSRKGSHFKAEIKITKTGAWKTLFEEEVNLGDSLFIGPYTSQTPEFNPKMFYRTEFDQIQIKQK